MDLKKYKSVPVKPSEITPEHIYLSRRQFMQAAGVTSLAALLAACGPAAGPPATEVAAAVTSIPGVTSETTVSAKADELGDPLTSYEAITNYNNYYEFTTDKGGVAELARDFKPSKGEGQFPWEVEVSGLVNKPKTYGLEDLLKGFTQEERVYRLRCVEGWSMVIPWTGFPLAKLLNEVEPTSEARYVRFETVYDPDQMPGQRIPLYPWPYQEGLRLDEAMNDLAILATGLYGKPLPNQDGAPLRLVVPWKYGFKSIKTLVKIELVKDEPSTLWSKIAPNEYGFYANVNPEVPHPRWSQASERRIGENGRRETLMFNGYGEQVASLYEGMDLRENY